MIRACTADRRHALQAAMARCVAWALARRVHLVLGDVLVLTGWKVPAPMYVTLALHATRSRSASSISSKCRRRRRDRAQHAREHGLVVAALTTGVRDVGRQRHMAVAFHQRAGIVARIVRQHEWNSVPFYPASARAAGRSPPPFQRGIDRRLLLTSRRPTRSGVRACRRSASRRTGAPRGCR